MYSKYEAVQWHWIENEEENVIIEVVWIKLEVVWVK